MQSVEMRNFMHESYIFLSSHETDSNVFSLVLHCVRDETQSTMVNSKKVIYCVTLRYTIKQSIWLNLSTSVRGAMYIDINMDMVHLKIVIFKRLRGAMDNKSAWRAKGPGIESHKRQEFFIFEILACFACRTARQWNCKWNHRGIHLANTLF